MPLRRNIGVIRNVTDRYRTEYGRIQWDPEQFFDSFSELSVTVDSGSKTLTRP